MITDTPTKASKSFSKVIIALVILALVLPLSAYGILRFALSKDNISYPASDHSHFRIKYIFQGQEEDFASPKYQTDYTKDICNGSLTTSPLHFHDSKNDYQHIHWARMSGGQWLKFYGINQIGGADGYMGFELSKLPSITPVPIYGTLLPKPRPNDKYWVYTGVEKDSQWITQKKEFKDFVNQDLETFLGVESQVRKDNEKYKVSLLDVFKPLKAVAHNGSEHSSVDEATKHLMETKEKLETANRNNLASNDSKTTGEIKTVDKDPITGEELKAINNFLGDIVIFVQADEPTNEQVQARFKTMTKLEKSVCGG